MQCWSGYVRLTQRWPALAAIVPFIPVVALWTIGTEAGVFPRVFLPGPLDVVRSFVTLTYKGILPDYLQDSLIRLFTGAALGMALGIPLGVLIGWAYTVRQDRLLEDGGRGQAAPPSVVAMGLLFDLCPSAF